MLVITNTSYLRFEGGDFQPAPYTERYKEGIRSFKSIAHLLHFPDETWHFNLISLFVGEESESVSTKKNCFAVKLLL